MDNGGYNFILDLKPYLVEDCEDFFMVYKDYKHIASFKEKREALDYILWRTK